MRSIAGGRAVASASESIDIASKIFILETILQRFERKNSVPKTPSKRYRKATFQKYHCREVILDKV